MDFSWSKEQLAQKEKVMAFAREHLDFDVVEADEKCEFPRQLWQKCAEFGIQSLSIPNEWNHSGLSTDFLSAMLAMQGLGYACKDNGLLFALNAQMWTVQLPILHVGSDQQKARFLPALCNGSMIGAHAMTEPEAGSDSYSLQTTATKVEGGYLLNGHKRYISLGPIADVAMVYANTNPSLGKWGISVFLVENTFAGYQCLPGDKKMGLRTVPFGDITFTDCFVPEANRLGPEGAGVGMSIGFLEWERCCIQASQLGAMERQLEECIKFVKQRKQFGQPIGKFQSVSNRIVDMQMRLETSRLLLHKVAWLKSIDKSAMLEAAMLKLHLSESFVESSMDAVRIHGGHGYLTANEIERDMRDAIGGVIYAGTSDIQRNIIARILGV